MKRQRPNTFIALSDFLMALTNVMFILFVFAFLAMAAKVHTEEGVKLKAEYLISAEWDLDHDADVDLYVRDPLGNIVYFGQREAGAMSLDHDSRGSISDFNVLPSGQVVKPLSFNEIVTLRGVVAGEYTVNLQLYGAPGHAGRDPYTVPVRVRIVKLNPTVISEFEGEKTIERVWQELTVTRFTLAANGDWLGADSTPMSMQGRQH